MSFVSEELKKSTLDSFALEDTVNELSLTIENGEKTSQKIAELEELNEVLETQINDRRNMYAASIKNLQESKERELLKIESDFEAQESEQENEFAEQEKEFAEQISLLKSTANSAQHDLTLFNTAHSSLRSINKDMQEMKIKSEINDAENEGMMTTLLNTINTDRKTILEKEKKRSMDILISNLENDIKNYRHNISMQREQHKYTLMELEGTLEMQKHYLQVSQKSIAKEMKKRDGFFGKHINIVEKTINNEAERTKRELNSLDNQVQYMNKIKKEAQKKYTILIKNFMKDIEKMEKLLTSAKEDTNDFSSRSMQTLSSAKNVEELKQKEKMLQDELNKVSQQVNNSAELLLRLSGTK